MKGRTYIAIDLKSFYASVECRERGLDPLDTNLGRCRRESNRQDHLPCRYSFSQELWHLRARTAVRGQAAGQGSQCWTEA